MGSIDRQMLEKELLAAGFSPDGRALDAFEIYAELLTKWNSVMNLTAITDPEGIVIKHFLDSVLPLSMFDLPQSASVIDVGTGAGFPGIPLKIMRNDISLTLLDSLNKRLSFLKCVADELGIDCKLVHSRAEDAGSSLLRESFDIATARAVARLEALSEYCLPLVKVCGSFAALKGADGIAELENAQNAIKILGGEVSEVKEYRLPNNDKRTLIIVKKVLPTPKKYPRRKGISASPL